MVRPAGSVSHAMLGVATGLLHAAATRLPTTAMRAPKATAIMTEQIDSENSHGCCFATGQFARVVKGVDLRSTAGNCAWARTPQLT